MILPYKEWQEKFINRTQVTPELRKRFAEEHGIDLDAEVELIVYQYYQDYVKQQEELDV